MERERERGGAAGEGPGVLPGLWWVLGAAVRPPQEGRTWGVPGDLSEGVHSPVLWPWGRGIMESPELGGAHREQPLALQTPQQSPLCSPGGCSCKHRGKELLVEVKHWRCCQEAPGKQDMESVV